MNLRGNFRSAQTAIDDSVETMKRDTNYVAQHAETTPYDK